MSPIELRLLERELRKSSLNVRNKQLAAEQVEELKIEMEKETVDYAKLLEMLQEIVKVVESEGSERWGVWHDPVQRVHHHKSTLSIVRRLYRKEKFVSQMRAPQD